MSKIRQQRTAEQIQHILSELFLREMNDPRLQSVSITEVTLDRELEHADVFVNALGDESRQDEVMAALNRASGFLRREVVSRMRLRKAPQFHFHWDPRMEQMQEVEDILENLDIPPEESATLPPDPT